MSRFLPLPLALLAVFVLPLTSFGQATISPPQLPPEKAAGGSGKAPMVGSETSTAPREIFRSGMQQILVKQDISDQVDGAFPATVVIVDAQGYSYSYVIQSKDGAANLEAALRLAESLRNCKKIVIQKHKTVKELGTFIQSFTLHVFDNR